MNERDRALDLHRILNVVTGGDDATLRELAGRIAADRDEDAIRLLAATAQSSEPQHLRSRCLQVLALAAAEADRATANRIMRALRRQGEEAR
jgi:hypothetical protein